MLLGFAPVVLWLDMPVWLLAPVCDPVWPLIEPLGDVAPVLGLAEVPLWPLVPMLPEELLGLAELGVLVLGVAELGLVELGLVELGFVVV